jgi:hypothetical protein
LGQRQVDGSNADARRLLGVAQPAFDDVDTQAELQHAESLVQHAVAIPTLERDDLPVRKRSFPAFRALHGCYVERDRASLRGARHPQQRRGDTRQWPIPVAYAKHAFRVQRVTREVRRSYDGVDG